MQKSELDSYLISFTQRNSKWIKDLNIRSRTIKFSEQTIEEKLHDIGLQWFLRYDNQSTGNKA